MSKSFKAVDVIQFVQYDHISASVLLVRNLRSNYTTSFEEIQTCISKKYMARLKPPLAGS